MQTETCHVPFRYGETDPAQVQFPPASAQAIGSAVMELYGQTGETAGAPLLPVRSDDIRERVLAFSSPGAERRSIPRQRAKLTGNS